MVGVSPDLNDPAVLHVGQQAARGVTRIAHRPDNILHGSSLFARIANSNHLFHYSRLYRRPGKRSIARILAATETRDKLLAQGFEPVGSTSDEFGAYIQSEIAKWGKVIKAAGIKAE